MSNWFQTRRFLCEFPIGSYVKLSSAGGGGGILIEGPYRLTYFWKRTIQWLFHQHLVLIEQMVSNKKIFMAKFGWDWLSSFRGKDSFKISSPLFLFLALWPSWLEIGITRHYCGRGPSNDHSTKVLLQLAQWFLRRRFLCEFPIGSYVKLSSAVGAILVKGRNRQDTFLEENHPMTI